MEESIAKMLMTCDIDIDGEKRLIGAVIAQAYRDAMSYSKSHDSLGARCFLNPKNKLFSKYCYFLGYDPTWVAEKLWRDIRQWDKDKPPAPTRRVRLNFNQGENTMTFEEAFKLAAKGIHVARIGWTDSSYLSCLPGMPYPWRMVNVPNPAAGNWVPTVEDLTSKDWERLENVTAAQQKKAKEKEKEVTPKKAA